MIALDCLLASNICCFNLWQRQASFLRGWQCSVVCVYFVGDSLHVSNRDSLLTAKLAPGETNGGDVNFAVSLSRLQAIAGACLPDEGVTLQESANAKTVAVTSERGKWLLQKVASDGFPFLKFDGSPLSRCHLGACGCQESHVVSFFALY